MKRKRKVFQCLISCLIICSACNKYLDIEPKGVQILKTATDYDQWLNNATLQNDMIYDLNSLADNIDKPTIANIPTLSADLAYLWRKQFSVGINDLSIFWNKQYSSIYYFNTVIQGIDAASGLEEQKANLKAEALLGRALNYLYLVNLYGKPYNPATSSSDLAVPFVTSNDISRPIPLRSTVKEIYDHIIADITAAIPALPKENNRNRFRGSVAAGYSVLARTYFFMSNYQEAAKFARMALDAFPDTPIDYRNLLNTSTISKLIVRPDAIYARGSNNLSPNAVPTLTFLRSYDINDLRLSFFYSNLDNGNFTIRGRSIYRADGVNCGPSIAEMQLIIAEAAARNNDLDTALDQLNALRKLRFRTLNYQPYTSTDRETIIQRIILERSFEFPFNGLRWLDMRRLDIEGRMSVVKRYNGAGNVIAELEPGSPRYVLQIPSSVMFFNPAWVQNP